MFRKLLEDCHMKENRSVYMNLNDSLGTMWKGGGDLDK